MDIGRVGKADDLCGNDGNKGTYDGKVYVDDISGENGNKRTLGKMVHKYNNDSNITNDTCCKYMNTNDASISKCDNDVSDSNKSVMDTSSTELVVNDFNQNILPKSNFFLY